MNKPTIVNLGINAIGTFGAPDCTFPYSRIPAPTKHIAKLIILQATNSNILEHGLCDIFIDRGAP